MSVSALAMMSQLRLLPNSRNGKNSNDKTKVPLMEYVHQAKAFRFAGPQISFEGTSHEQTNDT
jgi:hypothetical protein